MKTETNKLDDLIIDKLELVRLCEQVWTICYPERRPWKLIGKSAQEEWIRVFGEFQQQMNQLPRKGPPRFQNTFEDGKWYGRYGECKLCGGEIPYGHLAHCDKLRMEKQVAQLKKTLSRVMVRIHGMSYDWNADPDGMTREVGHALNDLPNT